MSIIAHFGTAIRERDWGTAIVDVLVVAIGILMALGVDSWRLDRESLAKEEAILTRAHHQIVQVENELSEVSETAIQSLDELYDVRRLVFEIPPNRDLSDKECYELLSSHKILLADWTIPAIEELRESGSLSYIADAAIRDAAIQFIKLRDLQTSRSILRNTTAVNLIEKFPRLLLVELVTTDDPNDRDGLVPQPECDLEGMRASDEFSNALHNNVQEKLIITEFVPREILPALALLHALIDARLGIEHT